jgi:hypothetical protein
MVYSTEHKALFLQRSTMSVHKLSLIINCLFWQTGSITRRKSSRRPTKRTLEFVDAVKEIMEKESKTSLRHLSSSEASVDLYPYRMTSVPEQLASDSAQRLQFFTKLHNDDASLKKTVFLAL